ncbi:DUF2975 domain-containing protein [Roseateles violae]|uniref:DUF2975 domain-containing protein n=1 Tax=Roseateles violae TaxID=3058042 RepID=A0ABT8DQY2_9BURK|nr:DUF2975 domain-containing protein [Pelomonas sp. PFR6]MDN3920742.1 DUF2975 domain-containing protein [Pelomonas sp. PFR6]
MSSSNPLIDPAGLQRIRRLAWLVRLLSLVGVAGVLLLPLLFWSQPDWVASVARREWGLTTLQLDGGARLGGLAATALPAGCALAAIWQIWRLFGCYGRGELLAPRPARHLHRLGLALVALAFAMPVAHTLNVLALTLGNPPGQRMLTFGLSSMHYLSLLFGLMLLALAAVMQEAARVADENAEFI